MSENAAATLTLDIQTATAEAKLRSLEQQFSGLLTLLKTPAGKDALQQVGAGAAESANEIKVLRAELAALEAKLGGAGRAAGETAKAIKTSMANLGGSFSDAFKLDDGQLARLKARLQAQGAESAAAFEKGLTTSNWANTNKALGLLETNTVASLGKFKALVAEANKALTDIGPVSAENKYGQFLLSAEASAKAAAIGISESVRQIVGEMRKLDAAEKADASARLTTATKVVKERQAAEQAYTAWWGSELAKREAAYQKEATYSASSIAQQLAAEKANADARLALALKAVKDRQASEASYTAWWATELAKREALEREAVGKSAAEISKQLAAEKADAEARLALATKAIKERQAAEQAYTAWWTSELAKRSAAEAASNLRTAKQRSGMQAVTAERLDRMLIAPAVGTSSMAQYYASIGAAAGGGTALRQAEQAAKVALAEQEALAAAAAGAGTESAKKLADAHGKVGVAAKQSATHLKSWNTVANEAHAAARGLSGALGGLWMTYGSLAPLLAGAAIAGSMKAVFTVGKDLEYELNFIKAITGDTVVSLNDLGKAVAGTMFTPLEAAKGLRTLAQAGLSTQQAMEALPSVLKLATVGETDMANAALSATSIMHTFGKSVEDISHIGDVFGKAAAISATSVTEMMEAMKQASSVSNVFGVTMEETAAALSVLANRGIEGSAAGTALRNMVKELASPATDKAANAMKQVGIEIFDASGKAKGFMANLQQLADATLLMSDKSKANFLETLFNERGAKAANILISDLGRMKSALKDIEAASQGLGFMTEAQIQISQSATGMVKSLASGFQTSLAEAFTQAEPQIKAVLSSITEFVTSTDFKDTLASLATSIANATRLLVEHADVVGYTIAAYAGFKVVSVIGASFTVLAANVFRLKAVLEGATLAQAGYAAALTATEAATLGSAAAATAATGAMSGLTAIATLAARAFWPLAVGLGVVAAAYGLTKMRTSELSEAQSKMVDEQKALRGEVVDTVASLRAMNEAQERLNAGISRGIQALDMDIERLAMKNRLMSEGKTLAEASAQAEQRSAVDNARANVDRADRAVAAAWANAQQFKPVTSAGGKRVALTATVPGQDGMQAWNAYTKAVDEQRRATEALKVATDDLTRAKERGARFKAESDVAELRREATTLNEKITGAQDFLRRYNEMPVGASMSEAQKNLAAKVPTMQKVATLAPIDTRKTGDALARDIMLRREELATMQVEGVSRAGSGAGGGAVAGAAREQRSLLAAEKASIAESYRNQAQMARDQYNFEVGLIDKKFKEGLSTQQEFNAERAALDRAYAEESEARQEAAVKKLENLKRGADKESQRIALQNAIDTIQNKAKEEDEQREIAKQRALAENEIAMRVTANEALKKTTPKLQGETQTGIDTANAQLQVPLLRTEDAAAQAAAIATTSRYAAAIVDLKAKREEALRLAGKETEGTLALRDAIESLSLARDADVQKAADAARANSLYAQSAEYGMQRALASYSNSAKDMATQVGDITSNVFKGMEDAFVEFAMNGKLSFKSLADSVISDLMRMAIRASITAPLFQAMMGGGGGGGLLGSLISLGAGIIGAPSGGSAGPSAVAGGGTWLGTPSNIRLSANANGNVFSGSASLHQYVNTVQTTPKLFAYDTLHGFAKGGIFAEAGPEAVMPLARDRSGRLGVRLADDGAQRDYSRSPANVTQVFNVTTPNPDAFRRSERQMMRLARGGLAR